MAFALTSALIEVPQPVIFTADRPFLYFLIHKSSTGTKTPLFNGRVNEPAQE